MMKRKISVLIGCYNEEENIIPLATAIVDYFEKNLPLYDYEILFIDNNSTDSTRKKIESICAKNKKIKAIFNIRNFGQFNSPFYGMCQTTGDCVIPMCADFQDPIRTISKFVAEWEKGYKIVIGIKSKSKENKFIYFLRSCYYKIIKKISDIDQIEHFSGFGLYDKSFIELLKSIDDPMPFLKGIVAEFGGRRKEVHYQQDNRRSGKTKNNWYSLYDAAMLSFTAYTKVGIRIATLLGFLMAAIDVVIAAFYFVKKVTNWDSFPLGMAPIVIGVFFFFSILLIFMGLLGEYILSIHLRLMKRPLVIEERRINF